MAFTSENLKSRTKDEFVGKLYDWHTSAANFRRKLDWRWYIYDSFYQGDHWVFYNTHTHRLERSPFRAGKVRLVINKIYEMVRAIVNFATSYRPKWEVLANSTDEDVLNNARKTEKFLDNLYDELKIKNKQKESTHYATRRGCTFYLFGWDEKEDKPYVEVPDTFDVYLDKIGVYSGDIQKCRFIDIAVQTPIQDIYNNKNYKFTKSDLSETTGEYREAASDVKELLQRQTYDKIEAQQDELGCVILHQTFYKKLVGEEEEVWLAGWLDNKLLSNVKTEFSKYPIISVSADHGIYGEGFVKNLISINKAINKLESQIMEYNNLMNRGRYLVDKNAGFEKITNATAEIIYKIQGKNVEELKPAGLSNIISVQLDNLYRAIKDISGVQDAFLGKQPAGVKSGVAIESLKSQTANNLQELRENQEQALAELGTELLKLYYNHQFSPKIVKSRMDNGNPDYFNMVSAQRYQENETPPENTYTIEENNDVRVTIGSGLAYTKEGRQMVLDKLYDKKIIGRTAYLTAIEFGGNIEAVKKEAMKEMEQEAMIQAKATQPQQPEDLASRAEEENIAMTRGEKVPPTANASKQHTDLHIKFSQTKKIKGNDKLEKILLTHIKGEEAQRLGME